MERLIQLIDLLEPAQRLELREILQDRIKVDETASKNLVYQWAKGDQKRKYYT